MAEVATTRPAPWQCCDPCRSFRLRETPAIVWFHCRNDVLLMLCQEHLDDYFGQCDERPELEPVEVRWVHSGRILVGAA